MIGRAQLSIDDLLGQLSRQFIEQLLVLSAQTDAGIKHPSRQSGDIRWHGPQSGVVALAQSKLRLKRPRGRTAAGFLEAERSFRKLGGLAQLKLEAPEMPARLYSLAGDARGSTPQKMKDCGVTEVER
jgi:hypothetical protein